MDASALCNSFLQLGSCFLYAGQNANRGSVARTPTQNALVCRGQYVGKVSGNNTRACIGIRA